LNVTIMVTIMTKTFKKFNFDEINADEKLLEESPIHGELDVEMLAFRQIERTAQSASQDEMLFACNVRILMSYLPSHKRAEVEGRADEYTSIEEHYEYKYNCGVPLGTPEHPICGSPWVNTEEVTDWHLLFQIILDTFEEVGVTWKFDKWTIEVGATEDKAKVLAAPMFKNRFKHEDVLKEDAEPKHTRKCHMCHVHIEPNTGRYYKAKGWTSSVVVHRKDCYDLAVLQWGEPE
jgi:hypothetical protein